MSFAVSPERRHLLPQPQNMTDYETIMPNDHNANASIHTSRENNDQMPLELDVRPWISSLSSCFCSYKPLKCLVIAFGLWSEVGRWPLFLTIPIAVSIFPMEIFINQFYCRCGISFNDTLNRQTLMNIGKDISPWFLIRLVVILTYLMMFYSIRQLKKHPQAIQLPRAIQMAKKTKLFNVMLFLSLMMIVSSVVARDYYFPREGLHNSEYNPDYSYKIVLLGDNSCNIYLALQVILSVVTWQAVICCLLFDVVMKALTTLVDQCLATIITTRAESIDDYIQLHQEVCSKVDSTFSSFKAWLNFNTAASICLLFWFGLVRFIPSLEHHDYTNDYNIACFSSSETSFITINNYFVNCVLFLFILFTLCYPWHSLSCLRSSFKRTALVLNDKTDWHPNHLLKNRFTLNCFIQYAKVAECRPFVFFTFTSLIPYVSIFMAVYSISLALYRIYGRH